MIRMVEYSMISVLEYFEDTLANVGLLESWLKCDWNCVNQVKKTLNMSRIESKQTSDYSKTETTFESNPIETPIESNQI